MKIRKILPLFMVVLILVGIPIVVAESFRSGINIENTKEISKIRSKPAMNSDQVAIAIDFDKNIIENDINVIRRPFRNKKDVSFPANMLYFKAIADSDDFGLVKGYIGSVKKARIVEDDVITGEKTFRGRIILEVNDQEQVDSYLITSGDTETLSFSTVKIENGQINTDSVGKLKINSEEETGFITLSDGLVLKLDIISLERSTLKPRQHGENIGIARKFGENENIDNMENKVLVPLEAKLEGTRKSGLLEWVRNVFRINSDRTLVEVSASN